MNLKAAIVNCGLLAAMGWAQTPRQEESEPSPMEAFAHQTGVHTAWSGEVARLEYQGARAVVVALVLEDGAQPPRSVRGVRVDLSSGDAQDRIYLDEEATKRTRSALDEIADAVAKRGIPGGSGCMGAREFWPLYNWPWNKYHELNAEYCGDAPMLVLSGRHKPSAYHFGESPAQLSAILRTALEQLQQH